MHYFFQAGVAVEVVRVLPESPPPNLTNIFCQSAESSPSEMVISLDCDAMPVLQVKTYRQKSGKVETAHYKATVSRLRARLVTSMSYNTLKGEMRVEGFPDVSENGIPVEATTILTVLNLSFRLKSR